MNRKHRKGKRPRMSRVEAICFALNCLVFVTILILGAMDRRSFVFLVPAYFSAIAFVLLVRLCLGAIQTRKKHSWRSSTGTILKVGIARDEEWVCTTSERGTTIFTIVMSVSYEVGGRVYIVENKTIDNLNSSSRREMTEILRQFAPGGTIGVRYNPENPNEAIIIAGPSQIGFGLLMMALIVSVFVVCGISAVYLFRHQGPFSQ